MPEFLCEIEKEGIKRPKEAGMLKWACYVGPEGPLRHHAPQVHPKDTALTKTIENMLVTGYQHHHKCSMVSVLCKPGLIGGDTIIKLGQ